MRTARYRRSRPVRLLSATLAAAAMLAPAVLASSSAAADRPGPAATPAADLRRLTLPGLHAASYTVTLLTGDTVRLTRTGNGGYSVSSTPTAGTSSMIDWMAMGRSSRVTSISAVPDAAVALIQRGALDRNLFDVRWLIAHGDTGGAARVPVTVRYTAQLSAPALAARAGTLRGATVVAAHAGTGTVDLKVDVAKAVAFWSGLTGQRAMGAAGTDRLAGGLSQAWPTGHRSAVAEPAAGVPTYQVVENVTRRSGEHMNCNGGETTFCPYTLLYLVGVDGDGLDHLYLPAAAVCADQNPCTTRRYVFTVPAGVYVGYGMAEFSIDQRVQVASLFRPQITVAGDMAMDDDLDTARKITISTPRPSEAFSQMIAGYRSTADDGMVIDGGSGVDVQNYWAIPSDPVTVGTAHFTTGWVLGKPPLQMTMTAPQQLDLHAFYWTYRAFPGAGYNGAVRFAGQHSYPVVDAGYGRAADFADLDARGKLAIIRIAPEVAKAGVCTNSPNPALVLNAQLQAALDAGAAGVLIDPRSPAAVPDGWCGRVYPESQVQGADPVQIPWAEIPVASATALEGVAGTGGATVQVTGYAGNSPYIYTPIVNSEGGVPAALHTTITDAQVVPVVEHYHAASPGPLTAEWSQFMPNEYFVVGLLYEGIWAPSAITDYRGPISPDAVRWRDIQTPDSEWSVYDTVAAPREAASDEWAAAPVYPGAGTVSPGLFRAQPGRWDDPAISPTAFCSFCREGNRLIPIIYLKSGADLSLNEGPLIFDPSALHLYRDGQEIPPTLFADTLPTYELPAERARYELDGGGGNTSFPWHFTSGAPATDQTPRGYVCVLQAFGSSDPCVADPLVFLAFDTHVGLDNTIPGSGWHRLDITAYHQAANAPDIRSVKLWTSVDSGQTWRPASVRRGWDGNYSAYYPVPDLASTTGTLSIKVEAADAGGNDVTETLVDAVPLAQ